MVLTRHSRGRKSPEVASKREAGGKGGGCDGGKQAEHNSGTGGGEEMRGDVVTLRAQWAGKGSKTGGPYSRGDMGGGGEGERVPSISNTLANGGGGCQGNKGGGNLLDGLGGRKRDPPFRKWGLKGKKGKAIFPCPEKGRGGKKEREG